MRNLYRIQLIDAAEPGEYGDHDRRDGRREFNVRRPSGIGLKQRQCEVERASELGNRTLQAGELPEGRRKRRFHGLQLVVALAGLLACNNEATDTTMQTLRSCADTVPEATYRFLGRNILAMTESKGGCGEILVALADGVEEFARDGTRCARQRWPAGFHGAWATAHASGLLVTSADSRKVLNFGTDGPAVWLDLADHPTQTTVYSVAQAECGERYAVLSTGGDFVLVRIGNAGEVLWERPGDNTDIVATCDGVYFTSARWKPEGRPAFAHLLSRVDAAGELVAEVTHSTGDCSLSPRLLGAVPGGVAVASAECASSSDLVQIHAPTGALLWSKILLNCSDWTDPRCMESITTSARRAFEWPAGHVAWLEMVYGPCPHYDCPWRIELVSHKMDGSLVMRRTIAATDASLALPIGDALWLGYRDGIDTQLSRLGPCKLP